MFKKRLLCIVMTLALLLTGLAGCGSDPKPTETTNTTETTAPTETTAAAADFELLLEAADAILPPENFASVEEYAGVTMIVCWDYADVAHWNLQVPADGTYTLRFVYSTDDDYEESKGLLYFEQNGQETVEASLSFPATGSDEHFAIAETTVDLKKGNTVLTVGNEFTEESEFFFINLVKIQVCQGSVPAPDLSKLATRQPADPDVLEGTMAGWWQNVLDMDLGPAYFLVNEDETSVIMYDKNGNELGTFDCRLEGDRFTITVDDEDETAILKGNQLFSPFDETYAQWEKTDKPGFSLEEPNFDGSWYRCGDTSSSSYAFSAMTYSKKSPAGDAPAVIGSGEVSFSYADFTDNSVYYPHHLTLELTNSDVDLTPSLDGTMLIEEDFFDYVIYVREDLATKDMIPIYKFAEALLNDSVHAEDEDSGLYRTLSLTANSFFIWEDSDEIASGKWKVADASSLELTFEDGTVENVQMPQDNGPIYVEAVDTEFYFDF